MKEVKIGDRVTHCHSDDFPGPGTVTGQYQGLPLTECAMVRFDQKPIWLDEDRDVSVTVKNLSPYVDPVKEVEPVNQNQIKVGDRVTHQWSSDFPGEGVVQRIEKLGKTHVLMDKSPDGFGGRRLCEFSLDLLNKVTPSDPFQVGTRVSHRYADHSGTGTITEVLSNDKNLVFVLFDKKPSWYTENKQLLCEKRNLALLENQSTSIVPRGTDAQATVAQATTSATSTDSEEFVRKRDELTASEGAIRARDSSTHESWCGLGSSWGDRRTLIRLLDESRRETAAANNTLEAVRKQRDQMMLERDQAVIDAKAKKIMVNAMQNERDRAISRGVKLEETIRAAQNELDKAQF